MKIGNMDDFWNFISLIFIFCIFVLPFIVSGIEWIYEQIKKVKKANEILSKANILENKKREIITIQQRNKEELLQIQNTNIQIKNDINNIIDSTQNCPWLAERISDYFEMLDTQKENYLRYKKNPAIKSSVVVSNIKKEKKELLKENKLLKYQLTFLISEFPMLEDAMQLSTEELKNAINSINNNNENKEEYEVLKNYLTPDEYNKLSNVDKYQLALERYLNKKKKSLWEVGISYERYIGYVYENKHYKVIYNGAIEGFNDLGRDIIAENDNEILIIQCKYWRKEKIIRENVIFQLYGTMILKQLETKKVVKGILVTTTSLSEEAKKIATYLNIQVKENDNFDKTYPCVKCNINRTTKEKIYHLPFDQQYDRIQIDIDGGEKYVSTVKEAEDLGFRRAKRHIMKNA